MQGNRKFHVEGTHNDPVTPLWQMVLGNHPDHYDLYRQVGCEQQVYRENKLSHHTSPHLLDQASALARIVKAKIRWKL
ncbi:MAG TPA: hypothetical protein V6C99_12345 [Oculatellaceae cyanobacterium]|jgi:hypothetical protein